MGWSLPYTLGVLGRWEMAAVYCQAVLCHGQRIGLDGAPAEAVDAEAKHLAAKQLVQLATRKVEKKAVEAAAPAVVKPKAASAPPTETPDMGQVQTCRGTRSGHLSKGLPGRRPSGNHRFVLTKILRDVRTTRVTAFGRTRSVGPRSR
jgi:sRNA-binding protein